MTRDKAIDFIWDLASQVSGEFCCNDQERAELLRQTEEALAALGVPRNQPVSTDEVDPIQELLSGWYKTAWDFYQPGKSSADFRVAAAFFKCADELSDLRAKLAAGSPQ